MNLPTTLLFTLSNDTTYIQNIIDSNDNLLSFLKFDLANIKLIFNLNTFLEKNIPIKVYIDSLYNTSSKDIHYINNNHINVCILYSHFIKLSSEIQDLLLKINDLTFYFDSNDLLQYDLLHFKKYFLFHTKGVHIEFIEYNNEINNFIINSFTNFIKETPTLFEKLYIESLFNNFLYFNVIDYRTTTYYNVHNEQYIEFIKFVNNLNMKEFNNEK